MEVKDLSKELCMGCMMPNPGGGKCNYCSYEDTGLQLKPYLPVRSMVAGKYIVGKVLYDTAESVTYIGWDVDSSSAVFITEFLPLSLAVRLDSGELQAIAGSEVQFDICYNNFLDMSRRLAKLRELSAISPVYDIVEDYGTVYAVSEFEESVSLRDYLLKCPGGRLPWESARKLFMPMLSTLDELHRYGVCHCGISTSTLRVCRDGRLRLFGFATETARTASSVLNPSLTTGFAAIEQYGEEGEIGSWTDIYGVCASLYRTLVGSAPLSAQERLVNDHLVIPAAVSDSVPAFVVDALERGMAVDYEERVSTVADLRELLSGSRVTALAQQEPELPVEEDEEQHEGKRIASVTVKTKGKKSNSKKPVVITVCIMLVVFVAIIVGLGLTVFRPQVDQLLLDYGILTTEDTTAEYTTTEDMVVVPDFVLNKATEIGIKDNKIWNRNFHIVIEYDKSVEVDTGYVCAQSVAAGTSVNKGSKIVLTICNGKPDMTLLNVVGMKKEDAVKALEDSGFVVTVVSMENDGSNTAGVVNQMSKQSGATYPYGTEVTISVWGEFNDE